MIVAQDVELRAGARILLEHATFRVGPGDRVGLVGRNGAGKTTLTRVLAGEAQPAAGTVTRSGDVGYLPQDPRTGDLEMLARDRVLSARGLDEVVRRMRDDRGRHGRARTTRPADAAMARYGRLEAEFTALGGYAAESEAATICSQPRPARPGAGPAAAARSPAASGAGSSWPASCSPAPSTLLLDEPTNHLDADSIVWLRDFLKGYARRPGRHQPRRRPARGDVVNKVFHLDANRAALDVYNVGWKAYLQQRETDERRRKRERANAEKKAGDAASPRPTRCAPRRPRPRPRRTWTAAPSGCSPGWRRRARTTRWPSCASRTRRRAAGPR